jgi:hypothetical protein
MPSTLPPASAAPTAASLDAEVDRLVATVQERDRAQPQGMLTEQLRARTTPDAIEAALLPDGLALRIRERSIVQEAEGATVTLRLEVRAGATLAIETRQQLQFRYGPAGWQLEELPTWTPVQERLRLQAEEQQRQQTQQQVQPPVPATSPVTARAQVQVGNPSPTQGTTGTTTRTQNTTQAQDTTQATNQTRASIPPAPPAPPAPPSPPGSGR